MNKRLTAFLLAAASAFSLTGCNGKANGASSIPDKKDDTAAVSDAENISSSDSSENDIISEEGASAHLSPMEIITAKLGTQCDVNTVIGRADGSNTIKLPLSDFIESGDRITSFTFFISSSQGDIGQFKGGCGISVAEGSSADNSKGWYQSPDFNAPTEGTYGEITWNVPENVADSVNPEGEILFGYWWGNTSSLHIDSIVCSYVRTKNVPVDGTESKEVGTTVNYNDDDPFFSVPIDFLPENTVPEVITYNISASGGFGKFNGSFNYSSSLGNKQKDVVVVTDSNNIQLNWFITDDVKEIYSEGGEAKLGFWWSKQSEASLDSIEVKYSSKDTASKAETLYGYNVSDEGDSDFRSASEIVNAINVGWNLGNALDSYKTINKGLDTETGWGNPKTTQEIVSSVKASGFNTIRIPVTWGEHMDGNTIQDEWMDRVQEVVDYAYNEDMFVILDMHHDDYIWFVPKEDQYEKNSEKLKAIWSQISERFKDYDDRLLFEGMNEPRTVGSAMEWMGGTAEERAVVNKYEEDFVSTVRSSGGNNMKRTLIVPTYAASAEASALNDIKVPTGGNIIVSVHYYAPWKFSEGKETVFDDAGKAEISAKFADLKSRFINNGIPVIIDEFGCINAAGAEVRADYYRYYVSSAKENGIKCVVWDNGVITGDGSFGILARETVRWTSSIIDALMEAAN